MPDANEQDLINRAAQGDEAAAAQIPGKTGFEAPAVAEDKPADPRASKRAELQAQLAALDVEAPKPTEMSDQALHIAFHDAVVALLGSHPSVDAIWQEIRARLLKSK